MEKNIGKTAERQKQKAYRHYCSLNHCFEECKSLVSSDEAGLKSISDKLGSNPKEVVEEMKSFLSRHQQRATPTMVKYFKAIENMK